MTQTKKRPQNLDGRTYRMVTGCGNIYITVNVDSDGVPVEVFTWLGHTGRCAAAQTAMGAVLLSHALTWGVPLEVIAKDLVGISCERTAFDNGAKILSCADAIGKVLKCEIGLMAIERIYRGIVTPVVPADRLLPSSATNPEHKEPPNMNEP